MPALPADFAERIELMKRRLQTEREEKQRVATITAALRTREQEHRTAEAKRNAAESSLAPLLEITGAQDLSGLSHKVEESKRVRHVLGQIHDLTQTILSLGDGFPLATLFQEVEGKTPDQLAGRSEELVRDLDNVWSAAGLQGKSYGRETSLRQCIRPLGGDISPGHDEFRCVPVLTSRSVVEDHYRDQVEGTPL